MQHRIPVACQEERRVRAHLPDRRHCAAVPPQRHGRPFGPDVVALGAHEPVVALAQVHGDDGPARVAREGRTHRVGERRGQMHAARGVEVARLQERVGAVERSQDHLAAGERREDRLVAVAHADGADLGPRPDASATRAVDAERIEFVPVEHDVVAVHVVDGERQRQHFEPVGDADEFVDVQ